ncbi:MAG: hypothetical protein QW328_08725 [Nitrososphaerota archaeon]
MTIEKIRELKELLKNKRACKIISIFPFGDGVLSDSLKIGRYDGDWIEQEQLFGILDKIVERIETGQISEDNVEIVVKRYKYSNGVSIDIKSVPGSASIHLEAMFYDSEPPKQQEEKQDKLTEKSIQTSKRSRQRDEAISYEDWKRYKREGRNTYPVRCHVCGRLIPPGEAERDLNGEWYCGC